MDYPISSRTVSLREVLLDDKQLIVPAYQRGYEWKDDQLSEFLNSIFTGYESSRKTFFGTIQFDNKPSCKEIVDGQQRLSTMILMLNLLEIITSSVSFSLNGLIDYRNVINANSQLEKVLLYYDESTITMKKANKDLEIKYSKNKYDLNSKLLLLEFNDYVNDKELNRREFAKELFDYLLDDVYFVILETENIPLPEIVSIFNTINTTGLDLNSSDIFKLHYYEYLRNNNHFDEGIDCMEKINDCYNLVEEYNSTHSRTIPMAHVLDTYKHAICARYGLSFDRLSLGNDTFFDYIFSNKPEKYSELLDYDKFKSLVEMYIDLFSMINAAEIDCGALQLLSVDLLEDSRYSRYRTIPYLSAFFAIDVEKADKESAYVKAMEDTFNCVRYFIVNSVNYDRVIEPVHLYVCNTLLPALYKNDSISEMINEIIWKSPYDDDDIFENRIRFIDRISYDLYENKTRAYIVCELSAILDELKPKYAKAKYRVKSIREKLFSWDAVKFDLEHIYPQNHFSKLAKDMIPMFNGIGNIIVLDRDINRAIKDLSPNKKMKSYANSKYVSAKEIITEINNDGKWNKEKVQKRLENQIKSLTEVLNGTSTG